MLIEDLIKDFEEECLFGSDRIKNFILYDRLLDKINNYGGEKMLWNLKYIRSYLAIIWYRLKEEAPNIKKCFFDKNGSSNVSSKNVEKVLVLPYGEEGTVVIFNTNLKDKYVENIYCLSVKGKDININISDTYPFYTEKELLSLCVNEAIEFALKKSIRTALDIIKDFWKGNLPSIKLEAKALFNFNCLTIRVKELSELDFDRNRIDPSIVEREKRLKHPVPKGRNRNEFLKNELRGNINASKKQSKLLGWDHIVIDGSDNLPFSLLKMILPEKYSLFNLYDRQLAIIEQTDAYDCLKTLIQRAIDRSFKLAYKKNYIVPIYFVEQNDISYVLPLYLYQREKPDCVLVFNYEKEQNDEIGQYVGKTLLNMDEARIDARILGEIDDYSWLL